MKNNGRRASCHRRSLSTMRKKMQAMTEEWASLDKAIHARLTGLVVLTESCEQELYRLQCEIKANRLSREDELKQEIDHLRGILREMAAPEE